MDTSALKAFAPAVRRQLMEAVSRKLDVVLSAKTPDLLTTHAPQVKKLRELADSNRPALVERVAYTWFNRFAALRYLDARGWHPFGARVLTAGAPDETQPELLKLARTGALPGELLRHTDQARLDDLQDGRIPSHDPQGEVYRHLVLAACRFYHALLPDLFERIDDETELLLPDDLLTEQSVAQGFRTEIREQDCAEVEILGWLYQFYISEKKDQVMARKSAVPAEDIPAVTQLFTPHWIVRYLVENSLGRLWLLNRPGSRLREQMPYYIEGEPETDILRIAKPEEIRVMDPAVGSGHMLIYAFDLLYAIYEEEGYSPQDIPGLILTHNLHGLDICPRAAQLAALALALKARERSSRFFQPERFVHPHIFELQDVRFEENELRDYIRALNLGDLFDQPMNQLLRQFELATTFGSLIKPCLDESTIAFARKVIEAKNPGGQLFLQATNTRVLKVLDQAEILRQAYHVVVTNPPYQEQDDMCASLRRFIGAQYAEGSADLCCAFILRNSALASRSGYFGLITMQSWMFLTGSADLRTKYLPTFGLQSMLHLGPRAFDAIPGEVVQTTAFVCCPAVSVLRPIFHRLVEGKSEEEKRRMFLSGRHVFDRRSLADFHSIQEAPLAYWASDAAIKCFASFPALGVLAKPCQGLITGETSRFLRYWYEVCQARMATGCKDRDTARKTGKKWFPQDKGGPPRRWYGNNDIVVNWEHDGSEIRSFKTESGKLKSRPQNLEFYFRPGVTWTKVSSGSFACRITGQGFIFSDAGMKVFHEDDGELLHLVGFLNSKVADELLGCLSETINYEQGNIARLPIAETAKTTISSSQLVSLACKDWDNFEVSWDFKGSPLLRKPLKSIIIEASWENWRKECESGIRLMRDLETENNNLFIRAYGLQDELSPEVREEEVTLARADAKKDMIAFLSYAVGCMMGRYSLDAPGLVLARAGDTVADFLAKVGKPLEELTFEPDADGIVPVLDGDWFPDDVVARMREFLKATFGEATLRENIRFIEESLGKEIRKYFLTEFYKDHLQTYKKRPIYWLVQSPGKGFSALIYLHRYTKDTVNNLLNRYVREYQAKLRGRLGQLGEAQTVDGASTKEKTDARKEADKLARWLHDCEEWERKTVLPLAQARIEIDLDDGVKVNYQKFAGLLAPIPGFATED